MTAAAARRDLRDPLFVPKLYEFVGRAPRRAARNVSHPRRNEQALDRHRRRSLDAMMSSQIELIKSRDTLLAVIDSSICARCPSSTAVRCSSPLSLIMQLLGRKPERPSIDETVLQNLNERLTSSASATRRSSRSSCARPTRSSPPARQRHRRRARHAPHRPVALRYRRGDDWLEQEIEAAHNGPAGRDGGRRLPRRQRPLHRHQQHQPARPAAVDHRRPDHRGAGAQERRPVARALIRGLLDAASRIDGVPTCATPS